MAEQVKADVIVTANTQQAQAEIDNFFAAVADQNKKSMEGWGQLGGTGEKSRSPESAEEGHERREEIREISKLSENMVRGIGFVRHGAMSIIGSGGDALGAGTDILDGVAKFATKMGPVGWTILAVAAVGAVTNALSKQYEQAMPEAMKQTAEFGELTGDYNGNHKAFVASMDLASNAASKFGYTLQDGVTALHEFAQAGVSRANAMASLPNDFGYARMYGLDPSETAGFDAKITRYLGSDNWLGKAAYGAEKEGLGPGQYKEFLDSTLSIFQEGLSRGIVKGFGSMEQAQVLFGHAGKQWQGGLGAQRIQELDRGMAAGTSLDKETDVLEYNAARADMIKQGYKNPKYNDVFAWEEGGVSAHPEMFKAIMDGFDKYGKDQMPALVHSQFGTDWNETNPLIYL